MARSTAAVSMMTMLAFQILFVHRANAAGFLESGLLNQTDVKKAFQQELSGAADTHRLSAFTDSLRQTFRSLPKTSHGNLGHQAVRYILHRLFVQQHGWYIGGLEPKTATGAEATAQPLSSEKKEEWVPSFLQEMLEKRLAGRGANLWEVAALAAAIEDLVEKEAVERLRTAYEIYGFNPREPITVAQAQDVSTTYLMMYLLAGNLSASGAFEMHLKQEVFAQQYPGWTDVKAWLHNVLDQHLGHVSTTEESDDDEEQDEPAPTISFRDVAGIARDVGSTYYTFNDRECSSLKSQLRSLEGGRPGRVRLSGFYKAALYSHWRFNEKIEYLRALGALDETDANTPSVIVPNYVMARANCLEASNLYAVCCRNECEDLMGHLEREIGAEAAQPGRILGLVAELASNTVDAPRNMSASLAERLQQVANSHGGVVPLHGRLFAQWMHHAYPRECPYPHQAGTTNPLTPEDWMKETGQTDTVASDSEMMQTVESDTCASDAPHAPGCNDNAELPWSEVEELLLVNSLPAAAAVVTRTGLSWKRELGLVGAGAAALALYLALQRAGHLRRLQGGKAQSVPMEFTQVKAALSLLAMAAWALDLLRGPALACAFCVGLAVVALAQGACAWACRRRVKPDEALTL